MADSTERTPETLSYPLTDPHETHTHGVVALVSVLENKRPHDLPPLIDTIDPDMLDMLFAHDGTGSPKLTLTYCGYTLELTELEVRVAV